MGLQQSKARRRLEELAAMKAQANLLMDTWQQRMSAEVAAGIPATPGTAWAVWNAALEHYKLVMNEEHAIRAYLGDSSLPMPSPTPPLQVTLPTLHAAAAPPEQPSATARGVEPDKPPGDASGQRGQQIGGGSSSNEEGVGAGGLQGSEAAQLLAGSAGQLAPGLRRRQAHGGVS